jgi:hypothetical protein
MSIHSSAMLYGNTDVVDWFLSLRASHAAVLKPRSCTGNQILQLI